MKGISLADASRFMLLWTLCPLVSVASLRFLFGGVAETMSDFVYHAEMRPFAFYSHVTLASLALALVPLQMWPGLRRRLIHVHRIAGRVYAATILVSGIGGLWLAVTTKSGPIAACGFAALAIAWIGATLLGVFLASRGQVAAHRRWMLRSASLTLAAVTLRLYLFAAVLADLSYEDVVGVLAWACWVPNLIVAEIVARRDALRPQTGRIGADAAA